MIKRVNSSIKNRKQITRIQYESTPISQFVLGTTKLAGSIYTCQCQMSDVLNHVRDHLESAVNLMKGKQKRRGKKMKGIPGAL